MKKSVKWFWAATAGLLFLLWGAYCLSYEQTGDRLCINEVMPVSSASIAEGTTGRDEWIELYNGTDEDIELEGYGLSDNPDNPYAFRFPDVIIKKKGHLLIYAGEEQGDGEIYTGYGLSTNGETLLLTDRDGETLDQVSYERAYSDHSYGRIPDGKRFALLSKATPGRRNVTNISRFVNPERFESTVTFSAASGYYEEEFELTLSAGDGETIFYTLDGSEPSMTSNIYKKPIRIYDRSGEPNRYANIRTTEVDTFLNSIGEQPVHKATVVRARTAKAGRLSNKIETRTYLPGKPPSLMTVSLVTDPENLFDDERGIYVPGDTYHYYTRTGKTALNVYNLGNYSERGKDSERPVSVCFINPDGTVFSEQEAGLRASSGLMNTSLSPVKSLRLYGSYKYDDVNLFPSNIFGPGEEKHRYDVLLLRTHSDFINNSFTDVLVQRIVEGEGLGSPADRPVIVYLEGEYWGLSYLREWIDEKYVSDRYGLDEENIAMVKYKAVGDMELKYGRQEDLDDFLELTEYAKTHDLSVDENLKFIADRLDLDNYIKTYLVRIYFGGLDWPDNNMRYYRAIDPDGTRYGDGKWRSILFDMDSSCVDYEYNMLKLALGEDSRVDSMGLKRPAAGSTELFTALMENLDFRNRFRAQYEEYKDTIFSKEHMLKTLDRMIEEVEPELKRNEDRWKKERNWRGKIVDAVRGESGVQWDLARNPEKSLQILRVFFEKREEFMDLHMEELYMRYQNE